MSIYLKNARYINWDTMEVTEGTIKVNEGSEDFEFVTDVPLVSLEEEPDEIIDCKGKYVTKSFVCAHHHIYSALARGMPAPRKIPENFPEILKYVWWTLDKSLDKDAIRASALATALYCLKAGTTCVIDHHASPNAVSGSLEIIAEALEEAGMSHLLSYELSDRDGEASVKAALEETDSYLQNRQGHVGLHASFTVGDELLKKAVALAEKHNTGVHVHVAEGRIDQEHCLEAYGKRIIRRYKDAGVLELNGNIFVHCLHLSDEERTLIADSRSWVVQNAESNLNNGVGCFDSKGLDRIMFGTDGMHSDMLRSAKASFFLAQSEGTPYGLDDAYIRFRNPHRYFTETGFTGDMNSDLVVLNYDEPTPMTDENLPGHFIFGFESRHVEAVISKGRLVVKDGKVLTLDEEDVLGFSKEQAKGLWARMQKISD